MSINTSNVQMILINTNNICYIYVMYLVRISLSKGFKCITVDKFFKKYVHIVI